MSEVAQLQRELERHTKMDEDHFGRLFAKLDEVGKQVAVYGEKFERNDRDNEKILEKISNLEESLTTSKVAAAEAKGSFDSFKVPVMVVVSGLLGGSVGIIFKLFER